MTSLLVQFVLQIGFIIYMFTRARTIMSEVRTHLLDLVDNMHVDMRVPRSVMLRAGCLSTVPAGVQRTRCVDTTPRLWAQQSLPT